MSKKKDYELAYRDALAAVAMTFAPSTDVPRERVLIRSALASLSFEFGKDAFNRRGAIKAISHHGNLPELRENVAESLFGQLLEKQIIHSQDDNGKTNYKLDSIILRKTHEEQKHINELIEQIISDLFEVGRIPKTVIPELHQALILTLARLMEKHGNRYAQQIAGRADEPAIVRREQLVDICKNSMSKTVSRHVNSEAMADAITELFKRRESHLTSFVFSLAQHYYYLRLLGLDGGLQILTDDRFRKTTFFVDTNLLIPFLFEESSHHRSVLEFVEITLQLEISLHVTEMTLEEYRRLIEHYIEGFKEIFDDVPEDLVSTVNNDILRTYRLHKDRDSGISPEEFLSQSLDARTRLESEWGITVFDEPVEHNITSKKLNDAKGIINKSSLIVRHRSKNDLSCEHDAHVFFVIQKERERSGDNSAWLLTLDRSLPYADKKLQKKDSIPFCLSLDGFLHIISPYVRGDHQSRFADMFVELISHNIFPQEEVIKIDDFLMFTNFDISISHLSGFDVKQVIRKVKQAIIEKGTTLINEQQLIGYEVQKALSDPTLVYHTQLENEIKQRGEELSELEKTRLSEKERHKLQLQQMYTEQKQANLLHTQEIQGLSQRLDSKDKRIADLEEKYCKYQYSVRILIVLFVAFVLILTVWLALNSWITLLPKPRFTQIFLSFLIVSECASFAFRKKSLEIASHFLAIIALFLTLWSMLTAGTP